MATSSTPLSTIDCANLIRNAGYHSHELNDQRVLVAHVREGCEKYMAGEWSTMTTLERQHYFEAAVTVGHFNIWHHRAQANCVIRGFTEQSFSETGSGFVRL